MRRFIQRKIAALQDSQNNDDAGSSERADLDLMTRAVREAGKLALAFYIDQKNNNNWLKEDGTSVSDADLAVDKLLHQRLLAMRPDYGWLSEETTDDLVRLQRSHVWIVDPIDGTRAFLHNKPHWVVSVALVVEGVVRMGCLYNPVEDEFFEAVAGKGARLNGKKLLVEGRKDIEGATIIAAPGRFKSPVLADPVAARFLLYGQFGGVPHGACRLQQGRCPIDPFGQK